ncbi:MAG: hypothetical protein IPK61_08695 [Saprospiraceae bacterium]|nr:hypothetical protein [Saprospiraceae bacterium]
MLYDTFYTSTAQICFDASRMKTEQIYYLIKVVGNDLDNNNLVDDDDDCFRISSQPLCGQRIHWQMLEKRIVCVD